MNRPAASDVAAARPPAGGAERAIWLGLAAILVAVVVAGLWPRAPAPRALPVLGAVPDFALVERSGRTVRRADLLGAPWVANFIYTTCPGVCPLLSTRMARLQAPGESPRDVRFVSFSVDPAQDTPEALRAYARRYDADPDRWWFLTGDRAALQALIVDGFRLSVAEQSAAAANPTERITHSDRFVLVDRQGQIRGFYRGSEAESLQELRRDLRAVHGRGG
jgi:protein SCO1/2